jgi:uncharacterized protein
MAQLIGVISDTHGLLRPEAVQALAGVELIIHGGDVGDPTILDRLRQIAPVFAVRGNVDKGAWADALPLTEVVQVDAAFVYVLHNRADLDLDPLAAGFHTVVSGHSHRPSIERRSGVLYLNPGAAGPRRFKLPVSVALLTIEGEQIDAHLIELHV